MDELLKKALEYKPLILCPFCEWQIYLGDKRPFTKWKKHIIEDKCYKVEMEE